MSITFIKQLFRFSSVRRSEKIADLAHLNWLVIIGGYAQQTQCDAMFLTLTILVEHSIPVVSPGALLALAAGGVVEAPVARARLWVAAVRVLVVDVARATTLLARILYNQYIVMYICPQLQYQYPQNLKLNGS